MRSPPACAAETGFVLSRNPDTVRAPDAAFVSRERAAALAEREKFFEGAPDLAAEVVSPGDTRREVEEKVIDYLAAGTRLVWVIEPRRRTVTVYRPGATHQVLGPDDQLDGGDLLPGFSLPVRRLVEKRLQVYGLGSSEAVGESEVGAAVPGASTSIPSNTSK